MKSGKFWAILIVTSLLTLSAGGVFLATKAVRAVREMVEGETRLHLAIETGQLIENYLNTTEPHAPPTWPTSWDDLFDDLFDDPKADEIARFPREDFEAEVIVDFTATLESVAAQERETLTAISLRDRAVVQDWRGYLPDLPQIAHEALERAP